MDVKIIVTNKNNYEKTIIIKNFTYKNFEKINIKK